MNKWSRRYWVDLAERVASTAIYGVVTLLTLDAQFPRLDWEALWPVVVLPTVLALAKGLLANLAHPESGASAVTDGPVVPR